MKNTYWSATITARSASSKSRFVHDHKEIIAEDDATASLEMLRMIKNFLKKSPWKRTNFTFIAMGKKNPKVNVFDRLMRLKHRLSDSENIRRARLNAADTCFIFGWGPKAATALSR